VALEVDGCCRGCRDERHFGVANVAVDRQRLVGRQRADHHWHTVAFDQLLGLGPRDGRAASRILRNQLNLATGDHAAALFEIKGRAFHLLLAASSKRTGIDGEESNLQRQRGLRKGQPGWQRAERCSQQSAARDRRFAVVMQHSGVP